MKYFRLIQGFHKANRLQLGSPRNEAGPIDPRVFTSCKFANINGATLSITTLGNAQDMVLANYDMPVFSEKALESCVDLITDLVQIIPVALEDGRNFYRIVNVLECIECIDFDKSEYSYWNGEDGLPQKVGQLKSLDVISINPSKTQGKHIFRLADWRIALIVSEAVVKRFEEAGVSGVKLVEVT